MVWRGSTSYQERFFAALVYLLPILAALPFGIPLLGQLPFLAIIYQLLGPLFAITNTGYTGLIIFFVLYLAVVRNEKIHHFIRFNTMQAMLLDILATLFSFALSLFQPLLFSQLLIQTVYSVIFLGIVGSSIYAIVQSILGRYAEIPTISNAAYSQVP
jgi:hypothetical protein